MGNLEKAAFDLAQRNNGQIGVLSKEKTNIQTFGAVSDGVTANDAALTNAKSSALNKKIYFPQNDTNNAVYYFTSSPNLDGYKLYADEGVKLSFDTTNGKSFKNVTFVNDIEIISRDRNNTGKQYKNDFPVSLFTALSPNEQDIGAKTLTPVVDSEVSKKVYTTTGAATTTSPYALDTTYNLYKIDTTSISSAVGALHTLELDYEIGTLYTCLVHSLTPETRNDLRVGVMAINAANAYHYYNFNYQKTFYDSICNPTWSETSEVRSSLTNAYVNGGSMLLGIRVINQNQYEVYANGVLIKTITTPFTILKIGFAMNQIVIANAGTANTLLGGIMKTNTPKLNNGNPLNVIVFGDSITFGEGTLSWAEFLPFLLQGRYGVSKVTVTNKAVSGEKAAQQYTRMSSTDLTSYDMVLIAVGTNDIQNLTDQATFKQTMTDMITMAKGTSRKVIVGVPAMFISQSLTGSGFASANYDKGGIYRNLIMQVATSLGVKIADTMSEIGRIGVDTHSNFLRDNLHPNNIGEIALAKCFARSVIDSISLENKTKTTLQTPTLNNASLQNSWSNFAADVEGAGYYKTSEGIVHIQGMIKGGTVTTGTLIFNLPVGYRPSKTRYITVSSNNGTAMVTGTIQINTNGDVLTHLNINTNYLILENIRFRI